MEQELIEAMAALDEDKVLQYTQDLLDSGATSVQIQSYLNAGLQKVGKLFENGDYFLADLIVSGIIYRAAMGLFCASMRRAGNKSLGRIIIGVVENDIHDIGKDIVCDVLISEGFEVIDLGIDVGSRDFVEAVRKHKPDVLALSGVMNFALQSMSDTIKALDQEGLRDTVAIVVGGSSVNNQKAEALGADAVADDPADTAAFCKTVVERKRHEE